MPFTWAILEKLRTDVHLTQWSMLQREKEERGGTCCRRVNGLLWSAIGKLWCHFFKSSKDLYFIFSACALVSLSIKLKQFYVSRKEWMKGKETLKGQKLQYSLPDLCDMSVTERLKSFALTVAFSVLTVNCASIKLLETIRFFFQKKGNSLANQHIFFCCCQYWFLFFKTSLLEYSCFTMVC